MSLDSVNIKTMGVTCTPEAFDQFRKRILAQLEAESATVADLARIMADLMQGSPSTYRNNLSGQDIPKTKLPQLAIGIIRASAKLMPRLACETMFQAAKELAGIDRVKVRRIMGRTGLQHFGQPKVPIPPDQDALALLDGAAARFFSNRNFDPVSLPIFLMLGKTSRARQLQAAALCEFDLIHHSFAATVLHTAGSSELGLGHLQQMVNQAQRESSDLRRAQVMVILDEVHARHSDEIRDLLKANKSGIYLILLSEDDTLANLLQSDIGQVVRLPEYVEPKVALQQPAKRTLSQDEAKSAPVPPSPPLSPFPSSSIGLNTSSNISQQDQIMMAIRRAAEQMNQPYVVLPRSDFDVLLATPKLVITGGYGRGKRTLLRNLITAINTQSNRSAIQINCRDPRLHVLLADLPNLIAYIIRPLLDPAADEDEITETICSMLAKGTLIPAFAHAEALTSVTSAKLVSSLSQGVKRFYITTTEPKAFAALASVHELPKLSSSEVRTIATNIYPEIPGEQVNAKLASAPSWLLETPLGVGAALRSNAAKRSFQVLSYVQCCIAHEGLTERKRELFEFAAFLGAFRHLRGNLDGEHHQNLEPFFFAANPKFTAENQLKHIRDLGQCNLIAYKDDTFVFSNSDLELLFAAAGWLMHTARLEANRQQAGNLLAWVNAWRPKAELIAKLIDRLPLPTSTELVEVRPMQPIIEFVLNCSDDILSKCQTISTKLDALPGLLQTWLAQNKSRGNALVTWAQDELNDEFEMAASWIKRISAHPHLTEYRRKKKLAIEREASLQLILNCKDKLADLDAWYDRSELVSLASNTSYKQARDYIRAICKIFVDYQADAQFVKEFDFLLNCCWVEWPAFILELLAIDNDIAFAQAIELAYRERDRSARDYADGRMLPLNEMAHRPIHVKSVERMKRLIAAPDSSRPSQSYMDSRTCEKLLRDIQTWGSAQ